MPSQPDMATAATTQPVFPGDAGVLPLDTRRVLVQLLLGPSVDGCRHAKLWAALLRDETTLRSRLHDLFLELVVDHDQQVAFTRQVAVEDLQVPILLRRANLTFLETVLLLLLRKRLTQANIQGERAVVSLTEMLEHLATFEPEANVDHVKFARQAETAVDKAKKLSLLRRLRGDEERFEVSPTLKLLFPAEEIQVLTRAYQDLATREAREADALAEAAVNAEHAAEPEDVVAEESP